MKLILRVLFLLMPVFADCQNRGYNTTQAGSDSIITPSLNRKWSATEFQEVLNSIISRQNNTSIEIITIDKNEDLFAKLTDIKNYWFLDSNYHTLNERFSFNLSLHGLAKTILSNYYQKSKRTNGRLSFDREIAAFLDLLFGITKSQMKLADEFIKATPNLTQIQLDGFKKMVQGLVTMEAGALITIEKEYSLYSEASICKITKSFSDFYSSMYIRIDQGSRTEFDKRIASLVKIHPIQCVRAALHNANTPS